ncbi:MAG TPA: hypothetical protein VK335_18810 [Bryobacteraceae bacterium]|nr:hypothetical protein [Bryobacteraceae bacterium]
MQPSGTVNGPTTGSGHWSPDGKWIVFDSRPNGNGDIFLVPASGGVPRASPTKPPTKCCRHFPGMAAGSISAPTGTAFGKSGAWIWTAKNRPVWPARERSRAAESPDGKWLFYTRVGGEAGVWRMPVGGGAEEKLTSELSPNLWGQWAVSSSALYYAVYPPAGTGSAIRRLDLTTHKVRDVVPLRKMPVQFDSGMSVSPDESWIVWSQLDAAGSDIYVVGGFR